MSPILSSFLNFSRWLAALLVVIGHVRHLVLVDFKQVEQKSLFCKMLYFVTGLGHEAVVIFFVISGFLVGGVTLDRWSTQGPKLRSYAVARISRLYTVLIPALLVGFALDFIGLHWFNKSELYSASAQYHTISLNFVIASALDIRTFVGNILMMQGILTPTFGSNGPLWSLAYEWWYYCIFALVAAAITGKGNSRIGYATLAGAMAVLLPEKLVLWGTIWLLGLAASLWIKYRAFRPHPILGNCIFLFAIIFSRLSHNTDNVANHEAMFTEFVRDFSLGVAYTLAVVGVSRMTGVATWHNCNKWLAEFSYTTYLVHFPMVLFIVAIGYQVFGLEFQVQPTTLGLLYLLGINVAVYLYCFAFSVLTERHTHIVRVKLDSWSESWQRARRLG